MTTTFFSDRVHIAAAPGVYAPQHDSHLLIDVLEQMGRIEGRTAVDLCTGSGVVAIAAARLGAAVTAWDVCPLAVQCARNNATTSGVHAEILEGPLEDAIRYGPFDIVLSNPPYVPTPTNTRMESVPIDAGPPWAWNAGPDGRLVLDRLCRRAPSLLTDGGTMLVVQSEFAGIGQSVHALRTSGLTADVIASQQIPFGPVLNARASWLESTGRLRRPPGGNLGRHSRGQVPAIVLMNQCSCSPERQWMNVPRRSSARMVLCPAHAATETWAEHGRVRDRTWV